MRYVFNKGQRKPKGIIMNEQSRDTGKGHNTQNEDKKKDKKPKT